MGDSASLSDAHNTKLRSPQPVSTLPLSAHSSDKAPVASRSAGRGIVSARLLSNLGAILTSPAIFTCLSFLLKLRRVCSQQLAGRAKKLSPDSAAYPS